MWLWSSEVSKQNTKRGIENRSESFLGERQKRRVWPKKDLLESSANDWGMLCFVHEYNYRNFFDYISQWFIQYNHIFSPRPPYSFALSTSISSEGCEGADSSAGGCEEGGGTPKEPIWEPKFERRLFNVSGFCMRFPILRRWHEKWWWWKIEAVEYIFWIAGFCIACCAICITLGLFSKFARFGGAPPAAAFPAEEDEKGNCTHKK